MNEAELQAIRYAFSVLAVLTGIAGTLFQIAAAWIAQLGGPLEKPNAAFLVGMAGTAPQDILIAQRRMNAMAATTASSYGSALLFAALIAGLVINFPTQFILGTIGWLVTVVAAFLAIVPSAYRYAMNERHLQERLFDQLPNDGVHPSSYKGVRPETTTHRADLLAKLPGLMVHVDSLTPIKRLRLLLGSVRRSI